MQKHKLSLTSCLIHFAGFLWIILLVRLSMYRLTKNYTNDYLCGVLLKQNFAVDISLGVLYYKENWFCGWKFLYFNELGHHWSRFLVKPDNILNNWLTYCFFKVTTVKTTPFNTPALILFLIFITLVVKAWAGWKCLAYGCLMSHRKTWYWGMWLLHAKAIYDVQWSVIFFLGVSITCKEKRSRISKTFETQISGGCKIIWIPNTDIKDYSKFQRNIFFLTQRQGRKKWKLIFNQKLMYLKW